MSSLNHWLIWVLLISLVFITCFVIAMSLVPKEYSSGSKASERYAFAAGSSESALMFSYGLIAISILWEICAVLISGFLFIAIGPFILSIIASTVAITATRYLVLIHISDGKLLNPYRSKFLRFFKNFKPVFY